MQINESAYQALSKYQRQKIQNEFLNANCPFFRRQRQIQFLYININIYILRQTDKFL